MEKYKHGLIFIGN